MARVLPGTPHLCPISPFPPILKVSFPNTCHSSLFILNFFFFGGTRVRNQGLMLARQVIYHLSYSDSSFFVCWVLSR
jgi:hypothetical protein